MHLRLVSLQNWFFRIDKYMENENSINALFVEPNAYIQKCDNARDSTKKVVFQQPYESAPTFYINNGFQKHDCQCVPKDKKKDSPSNSPCDCGKHNPRPNQCNVGGFNIQNLLPLLGLFNSNKGGMDLSKLTSILNIGQNGGAGGMLSLISSLMSNKDLLSNIFKSFTGSKLNSSKSNKEHIKSTDFEIKNYTRVN